MSISLNLTIEMNMIGFIKKSFTLSLLILVITTGCSNHQNVDIKTMHKVYGNEVADVPHMLDDLAEKSIYFGHQSVGKNILSGLEYWNNEGNQQLNIIETRDFSDSTSSSLMHFRIGQNRKPFLKIDDFYNSVPGISSENQKIAFFKFCYVDFSAATDTEKLFSQYKSTMLELQENYPDMHFVLITAPLKSVRRGIDAIKYRVRYGKDTSKEDNVKRNEFNEKLRNELGGKFPVFDLAKVEATQPDGSLNTYEYNGEQIPALYSLYTNDGGHLNETGAKIVAFNLLSFLSDLPENK